ncbi:MAG: hypothetical protein E4H29_02620 [Deltaproteobacteria bacterium]|nr:MAG: hypothetical protein E4H29_02620 [Deltaproteobacteria bacterium]
MKISLSQKAVWITIIVLSFFLLLKGAEAADYRVTPSIRLGQGWDSNIFGTNDNAVSDFYTTVTPELTLAATTPNLSMQLLAGVEGRWYYDHPEVSSAGYSKNVRLISGWQPTARFSISPAAYFLETLDSTSRSFLVPVDPTVPPQGIATYGLQKSRDFGASIGLRYQVSPALATGATVYGATRQLPDESGEGKDSRTLGADVSVQHTFSQKSSAGVYGNGSKEYFKETPDAQVFGAGLLAGHQFSPSLRMDGRIGMSFVRQPATATDNSEHTTNDPAGTITLAYSDNTFRASLYANVGYSGLSGASQITRQGTVGINLADQFAQRWSWNLGGNFQISRTVFADTSSDVKTINGTGSIRYAPWERGTLDLTGNAIRQQSDVPNGDLNRYSVVLGFTLGKTYTAF